MKSLKTFWAVAAAVVLVGAVCLAGWGPTANLPLVRTRPTRGAFFSLQHPEYPPLPFNQFPELPLFSLGDDFYLVDDRTVDYVALREQKAADALVASLGADGAQGMDGPPRLQAAGVAEV